MEKKTGIDEAAVWRRVNAAAEQGSKQTDKQPEKQTEKPMTEPLLPGLLAAMTEGAGLYDGLMGLYRKTGSKTYTRLAQGQKGENRGLKSLYFLLSGTEPVVRRTAAYGGQNQRDWLRQLLMTQQKHLETMKMLQNHSSGKTGDMLRKLAAEAEERWDQLLRLLQKQL